MAAPGWWQDWTAGTYNDVLYPLEVINLLIPYMQPAEQRTASRYLYNQRAADDTLSNWLSGYNVTSVAAPVSQRSYLQDINRAATASLPEYDLNNPAANWLTSVLGLGRNLRPGMSRAAQRDWRSAYDTLLAEAPSESLRQAVSYVYNPTLSRPEYGSATLFGQYAQPYRVKGGLVGNPYYAT
jgi:hypothetical protein